MACRELLRKLESRHLIKLPPRQRYGVRSLPRIDAVEIDQTSVVCALSDIKPIEVINVRDAPSYEKTFNYLLKEYHYLSYGRPVGQNMKYIIVGKDNRILGCLLFSAEALIEKLQLMKIKRSM